MERQLVSRYHPALAAHGVLAWVLVALVGLHVAVAAFHQLVRRDRLFSRMGVAR